MTRLWPRPRNTGSSPTSWLGCNSTTVCRNGPARPRDRLPASSTSPRTREMMAEVERAGDRRHTNKLGETRVTDNAASGVDHDAEQLKALGYVSHFDRTMSKWENFSLGFTYLSPVVGVYTIFASAFVVGGPPMWWTYTLVGLGQLMVALIFGEIVSQFPISGGLYPWARRLMGKRWAWMAGWVYAWALCCTMAGVATGVAPFVEQLFGLGGTRLLARAAMFGFICELVGAIVVGGYLLLFARHQPLKVLIDTSIVHTNG